ncbi:MAG: ABC transporter permease subunit [Caldilineaceae bacterium]
MTTTTDLESASVSVKKARPRFTRMERAERRFAFLMLVPALLVVFAIMAFPWGYSFWLSLNELNIFTKQWTFVGLNNYITTLPQPASINAFLRTVWFSALLVIGTNVVGMIMALVLNQEFKGRGLMRSIMLMPWAVAPVVVGKLFSLIYSGEYGVLNGLLYQLHLIDNYIPFLAEGRRALLLVALAAIWSAAPLNGLLLLAGLQSIPANLYNAAKIDGANAFARFRHITLPWLRPMLLLIVILTTINAVLTFDLIFVLTQGGPGEATTVFSWLGYITYFNFGRYGEGAAILYTLSIFTLLLAIVYMRLLYGQGRTPPVMEATTGDTTGITTLRGHTLQRTRTSVKLAVRRSRLNPRVRKRLNRIGLYLLVLVIAVWSLAPFYVMFNTSLSTTKAILNHPPSWFPNPMTFENYRTVIFGEEIKTDVAGGGVQARAILISMKNSAIVALAVTLVNLLIGAPAGYAYARFSRYRFTGVTLWLMMMTRMIPALTLAVPFFVLFRVLGLNDTLLGLIVAYSSLILPLVIWITKGYFETIPPNMERAALVDGCNRLQSFMRVVLPVAMPGLMAAGIFCFLVAWNEFVYALLLTSSLNAQTLPTRIPQFVADQRIYNPGLLFAAGALAIIPPVFIAFVFQRYLLQGMLSGATKG